MRGYFGIGIVAGKTPQNVGTLWRSAHAFGAAFIFTVGHRYPSTRQPTDTTDATRHVPLYEYVDVDHFLRHRPLGTRLVAVEFEAEAEAVGKSRALPAFSHPERAVYLLGAEDKGLSARLIEECDNVVYVPTLLCLNVAVAGSIVMYDRSLSGRLS